jgi:hypothetical protein
MKFEKGRKRDDETSDCWKCHFCKEPKGRFDVVRLPHLPSRKSYGKEKKEHNAVYPYYSEAPQKLQKSWWKSQKRVSVITASHPPHPARLRPPHPTPHHPLLRPLFSALPSTHSSPPPSPSHSTLLRQNPRGLLHMLPAPCRYTLSNSRRVCLRLAGSRMYRGNRVLYAVCYQAGVRMVVVMRDELVGRFWRFGGMEVEHRLLRGVAVWRQGVRRGGWMREVRRRDG